MAKSLEQKRADQREANRRWRERQKELDPDGYKERCKRDNRAQYVKNAEKRRKSALEWQKNNPERYKENLDRWRSENQGHVNKKQRENYLTRTYGIDAVERDAMLEKQGGVCATCGTDTPGGKYGWNVDHCHSSNKIRGILCHQCNITLGLVKDNPATLRNLANYLER